MRASLRGRCPSSSRISRLSLRRGTELFPRRLAVVDAFLERSLISSDDPVPLFPPRTSRRPKRGSLIQTAFGARRMFLLRPLSAGSRCVFLFSYQASLLTPVDPRAGLETRLPLVPGFLIFHVVVSSTVSHFFSDLIPFQGTSYLTRVAEPRPGPSLRKNLLGHC